MTHDGVYPATNSLATLATAALRTRGSLTGEVHLLAEGMSSAAFVGDVDGGSVVARVPKGDGRRPTPAYRAEARLLDHLHRRGAAVAPSTIVSVDGVEVAVSVHVEGAPVTADEWTDDFVADVAATLALTHAAPPNLAPQSNVVTRFHLARIWPFDGTDLREHPVADRCPELVAPLEHRADAILAAAETPIGVVHTDLHWQHLLRGGDGRLTAILDFGDAFAGVPAWDVACLRYYVGRETADRVTQLLPDGAATAAAADEIGLAFALYKLDKTPERDDVVERVERMLRRV